MKLKEILNNKLVMLFILFLVLSVAGVLGGSVYVQQNSLRVGNLTADYICDDADCYTVESLHSSGGYEVTSSNTTVTVRFDIQ